MRRGQGLGQGLLYIFSLVGTKPEWKRHFWGHLGEKIGCRSHFTEKNHQKRKVFFYFLAPGGQNMRHVTKFNIIKIAFGLLVAWTPNNLQG